MRSIFFKKAAAIGISCALILCSARFSPGYKMSSEAAESKSRVSVHDPSVIKDGSTYYVFGSHIDAAKTTDLQNWTRFTNGYTTPNNVEFGNLSQNLKKAFDWAGEDLGDCEGGFAVWAPDVVWNPDYVNSDGTRGAYLMYFCTSSTWNTSVIACAASKTVEGPYNFVDTLIYSGFTANDTYAKSSTKNVNRKYTSTNIDELIGAGEVTFNNSWFADNGYNYREFPNAIDPTIYYDTDGKMYMVYGSWSGGIFTLEIDPSTGRCIRPKSGTTADGRVIDSYFGTKLAGGYHKSGEGPFIEYNADTGYYYLWETYGGLLSEGGYNMRVFRSSSPTGPFLDPYGNSGIQTASSKLDNAGLKVMGNYKFSSLNKAYMACGHNSVLRDDDGQWYLFYHARFDDGTEYHEVRVHQMYFNSDGWPVVAPFEYSGDKMSETGYNDEDIAGEYEFINHGSSTDGKIISSKKITLGTDGSITGDAKGEWQQDSASSAVELKIDGQLYSGYFLAAKNEAGTKVMSFTAVGSNNQTVWGAKTAPYSGSDREVGIPDYTNKNAELVIAPDTLGEASASAHLSSTSLISGIPYYIVNENSGLALDIPNGKLDDGTNIHQWDNNGSWAQQWRLVSVDDKYFRIVSMGDETKCVAVAENSASDGVNVELQTYTGADNQLFKLEKNGSYYGILSKCSDGRGALDVFEWSKENGGNVNQYAYHQYACQQWTLKPVCPQVTQGTYVIKGIEQGYVSRGNSGLIMSDKPQELSISKLDDGTFTVSAVQGGDDVKVRFICNKDGTYSILTSDPDQQSCFQRKPGTADMIQSEFTGDDSQKFILEPVKPSPKKVIGDVNADGEFTVADVVMMQNYLLGRGELTNWEAGDLCNDCIITVFDLIKLKRLLLN